MKSIFLYLSLFILFTIAGCGSGDRASPPNKQPIQKLIFNLANAGFNEYDEDEQAARKVKLYFMANNQEGYTSAMAAIETATLNTRRIGNEAPRLAF